jgi:hypothetical protein
MQRRERWRWVAVTIGCLLLLFLSGCGMGRLSLELTLYRNERYQMDFITHMSPQDFAWIGRPEYEQQLEARIAQARAEGHDASLEIEEEHGSDSVRYVISLKGQGYGDLTSQGFRVECVTYRGRDAISVYVQPFAFAMTGPVSSLTLRGAKILESDGVELDRGVVTWHDLNDGAYAVLLPKGSVDWATVFQWVLGFVVLGGVIAGIAFGGVALVRARERRDGVRE